MPTYGYSSQPTNVYCVDGICRYTYGTDLQIATDAEGNILGVDNYGSLGSVPPATSTGTSGFGGTPVYPGDVVPPAAIGSPTPPVVVTSVPPTPGGVVTMEDSAFITDGEIRSTGWLSPNVVTQRAISGATWDRPTATMTVDGDTATIDSPSGTQMVARDFRANVPLSAVVVGVDVEINGRFLTPDTTTENISLIRCGGLVETGGGGCSLSGSFEAWSTVSGIPPDTTISYLGAVSNGTVIGGLRGNYGPSTTTFQAFNPVSMAYEFVTIPVDTTGLNEYDLPIVQANGRLYLIVRTTGAVYLYSPGTLTFVGTISGGLPFYLNAVTLVIGGREQVYCPNNSKRLEFPTDSTLTVHSVSTAFDFDSARHVVGYQDKMLAVNGTATSAFLYSPVTNTTTAVAAPPSGYFKQEGSLALQLPGEANTSAFFSNVVLAETEWSVATYCHDTDTWSNPFTFNMVGESSIQGVLAGTTRLIGGAAYAFSPSGLYKTNIPSATGGVSSVLTPVNLPNYDEGRVLPGDLGTYTCELIAVKSAAADLTTQLIARQYEGPAVDRAFVNDPSFGVAYALTTTGASSAAIDSISINVKYATAPFADVVPPGLAGANGYTAVAFSQDGSTIVVVGVDGKVVSASAANPGVWTPVALPDSVAARDIYGVASTRYGLIFVGESGLVLTELAVDPVKVGTTENFTSIAYDYLTETVVITGTGSGVVSSTDSGSNFAYVPGATELPITYATTIAPTAIIRVGEGGMIQRSTDGTTWTTVVSGTVNDLYDVHFDGLAAVAVGEGGTILYSGDGGQTWTPVASGTVNDLYTVSGAANVFIAAGAGGVMLQSQNAGYTWAPMTSGTTSDLRGSAVAGGTYVVAGDELTIISGTLSSNLLDVTMDEAAGISDSFEVTMHYQLTLDDELMGRADEDRNILEQIDESYEPYEMGFSATVVLDEDIGEDAVVHVGGYTNPHFLDELISISSELTSIYGATVVFDDILDGSDSIDTVMLIVLMMNEELNITHEMTSTMMLTLAIDETLSLDDIVSGGLLMSLTIDETLVVGTLTTGLDTTDETNWNCWVMNTETKDVTRYTNFRFTSMARVGEQVFATDGAKIYQLGGDTDAGANINAEIELPITDFDDSHIKNVNRVYLGLWADGRMALKTITEGLTERWYSIDPPAAGLHELRVPLPKGVKARYWSFKIGNELGSDFTLDSVTLLPIVLSRRLK